MTVYRDFDQEALDLEYTPSALVADIDGYLRLYEAKSAVARAKLKGELDVGYGASDDEVMDIFTPGIRPAPVQLFIHGGNWQMLSKNESSASAPDFVVRGAAFAALNYALAPTVTLDEMVRQCRAAVVWLYRHGADHGLDPERIYLSGHSAGGHLAAMLLCTDWEADFGLPRDVVKGATIVSGLFDLEPVHLSYVNEALGLDPEGALRNSPIAHLPETACPLTLAHGDNETAEFKRQTSEFAAAWRASGLACEVIELKGFNHFDVILELGHRDSPLGQAVLRQMGLLRADG